MLNTQQIIAVVLLVGGGILFYTGWQQRQSLGSRIGDVFGSASSEPMWWMAAGAVAVLVGLFVIVKNR